MSLHSLNKISHNLLMLIYIFIAFVTVSASAGDLKGIILDENNGKPVQGAAIELEEINRTVVSNNDGTFSFYDIPDGFYTLIVSRLGYYHSHLAFEVSDSDNGELAIYLMQRPIEIGPEIVTTQHSHSKFDQLSELSHTLKGKELQKELGQTLASTLKNETGLAIRSMGPAPARPVIRGLGGDRVTISEDGNKTTDLSATSPDHAVTIEPFSLERIEVLRGPKVLKHSSTTIGGVVNVIRHEIPQDEQCNITGVVGAYGETANRGYLNSAQVTVPVSDLLVRGEINRKNSSDLRTPIGKLGNSYSDNLDFSIGGSVVKDWGFIGTSLRQFELDYGIPGGFVGAHPNGVDIEMQKRQINIKARYEIDSETIDNIETHFARAYYRHKEFEASGAIGTEFKIVNYLGYANLNHNEIGLFDNGTFGISGEFRDLDLGGLVFSPSSKSTNIATYLIENVSLGKTSIEAGIRYNYADIVPDEPKPDSRIGNIRKRDFQTFSASLSVLYEIDNYWSIGANISRSSRTATLEELFSEGPHLAAYSYEIGNPDLDIETGIGSELFAYMQNDNLYLMANLFYNDLDNYIIHRNTGQINWTTVLPEYAAMGVQARLYGIESQLKYNINHSFELIGSLSYTIGEFKQNNDPLPQIPPLKSQIEFKYTTNRITAGANAQIALKQDKVDEFEEPTDGYTLLNTYLQYTIPARLYIHSISLNLDNIFDTEYRNHLSRVKSILPEAGRNLRLTYKLFFDL